MGDWDDDDWEASDIKLTAPAAAAPAAAQLASAGNPDAKQFADEEDIVEDEPEHHVPKTQPKKKEEKKWKEGPPAEESLSDPLAEKLRRQRLVEQADFDAARELFGASGKPLEAFLPRDAKDFEDFATEVVNRAILPHKDSKNYKVLLKAIVRLACAPLNSDQAKEVEDVAGTARVEKQKAEKAKLLEKKPIKKSLGGVGKGGAAGLDEMIYDDDYDDGEDFM